MNIDFTIKPKVTKDLILSRFSEEQIMEYYLHVPVKKGLFRSPIRKDNRPTCSFFRNSRGELIFKDFGTGQYLNCFEVVKTIYNCDYFTALNIIANDFNIIYSSILQKNPGKINSNPIKLEAKETAKIQVEIQDFTDLELKWWEKYGITPEILKKYNVYSCKHVFLNGQLVAKSQQHCPIFGYYGDKVKENGESIELWRCYFPQRKSYRWISNYPKNKIQGFDNLPKTGKLLIITKSLKDVMCLSKFKIPACAPNSEVLFIKDNVLKELKERFENIVVWYDTDIAGISNMRKIKKKYPELFYYFIPRKYKEKDFTDFYKKYGINESKKLLIDLINNIKWHKNVQKKNL